MITLTAFCLTLFVKGCVPHFLRKKNGIMLMRSDFFIFYGKLIFKNFILFYLVKNAELVILYISALQTKYDARSL